MVPIAIALLALSACGGGGGGAVSQVPAPSQGCTATTCGTVLVGITEADGDFLSYSVDVVSLSLRRADGTVVQERSRAAGPRRHGCVRSSIQGPADSARGGDFRRELPKPTCARLAGTLTMSVGRTQ